ncbi:MAG: helix-hairpin-helix domain-containing protein [bacterium]|nr:helix-hairpin-helix domain-containing protein [bacterium]
MINGGLWRRVVAHAKWLWINRSAASRRQLLLLLSVVLLGVMVLAYRTHFSPKHIPMRTFALPDHGPLTLKVHIVGAVARPGLYDLAPPKRVFEAIDAAGGFLSVADRDRLNLAKYVEDGDRIVVRERKTNTATRSSGRTSGRATTRRSAAPMLPRGKVSINLAPESELVQLPGIGPATAKRIISYRQEVKRIRSLDELTAIKGLGVKTVARLREYLTL